MRVYEAKLVYEATLFEVGATALNSAESVYAYMKDTLEVYPTQEVFHVILLNRKNRPLGRNLVTIGTAGSTLVHPREVYRSRDHRRGQRDYLCAQSSVGRPGSKRG